MSKREITTQGYGIMYHIQTKKNIACNPCMTMTVLDVERESIKFNVTFCNLFSRLVIKVLIFLV